MQLNAPKIFNVTQITQPLNFVASLPTKCISKTWTVNKVSIDSPNADVCNTGYISHKYYSYSTTIPGWLRQNKAILATSWKKTTTREINIRYHIYDLNKHR